MSVWARQNGLTLGQVKTAQKSNEIPTVEELLRLIDIKDCTVTLDAMGCQESIAQQIQAAGSDYILAVKANQKHLHSRLTHLFKQAKQLDYEAMVYSDTQTI